MEQLVVGQIGDGVQRRSDHFHLAVGIVVRQLHLGARLGGDVGRAGVAPDRLRRVARLV